MSLFTKNAGVWAPVTELSVHNNGNFVPVKKAFVNQAGVWHEYFSSVIPPFIIEFLESTEYTPPEGYSLVDVFMQGGGGGGGANGREYGGNSTGAGGGGAGYVLHLVNQPIEASYSIRIGAGGAGGVPVSGIAFPGDPGEETSVNSLGSAQGGTGGEDAYGNVVGMGGEEGGGNGGASSENGGNGEGTNGGIGGPAVGTYGGSGGGGGAIHPQSIAIGGNGGNFESAGTNGSQGGGGGGGRPNNYASSPGYDGGNGVVILTFHN